MHSIESTKDFENFNNTKKSWCNIEWKHKGCWTLFTWITFQIYTWRIKVVRRQKCPRFYKIITISKYQKQKSTSPKMMSWRTIMMKTIQLKQIVIVSNTHLCSYFLNYLLVIIMFIRGKGPSRNKIGPSVSSVSKIVWRSCNIHCN